MGAKFTLQLLRSGEVRSQFTKIGVGLLAVAGVAVDRFESKAQAFAFSVSGVGLSAELGFELGAAFELGL